MLAVVRIAGAALVALAAVDVGLNGYLVTNFHVPDFCTDLLDDAAALMTQHERVLRAVFVIELLSRGVPLPAAVVRTADGCGLHLYKYLVAFRAGLGDIGVFDASGALLLNYSSLDISSVIKIAPLMFLFCTTSYVMFELYLLLARLSIQSNAQNKRALIVIIVN